MSQYSPFHPMLHSHMKSVVEHCIREHSPLPLQELASHGSGKKPTEKFMRLKRSFLVNYDNQMREFERESDALVLNER